jgi:putative transposase
MANTYTQIYYHIVFSTKHRQPCLAKELREKLYAYIWGIHKQLHCHLYRIGGVEDHVHLLTSLHPTLSLAKYVESIKTGSTNWIRRENIIDAWPGWQDGYGAFTAAQADQEAIVAYIKDQETHHQHTSFLDEYKALLERAGVTYDPKYIA